MEYEMIYDKGDLGYANDPRCKDVQRGDRA
jgi:hypothetical protein